MKGLIIAILLTVLAGTCAKAQHNYSVGVFYGARYTYEPGLFDDGYPLGESIGFEVGYHFDRSALTIAVSLHDHSSFFTDLNFFLVGADDINGLTASGPFYQESTNYSMRFISFNYSYVLIEKERTSFSLGGGMSQVNGIASKTSMRGEKTGDPVIIGYYEEQESGQSINITAKVLQQVSDYIRIGLRAEVDVFNLDPALQVYFETRF